MTISPFRFSTDSISPIAGTAPSAATVPAEERHRILLVDDDETLRMVQTDFLKRFGYRVHTAHDGDVACDFLMEQSVDLVITDMVMPHTDGVELIRHIRKRHPDTKVIAMSGGGTMAAGLMVDIARMLGVHAALAKPFTLVSLRNAVREVLSAA